MEPAVGRLATVDVAIIVVYLVGITISGSWFASRQSLVTVPPVLGRTGFNSPRLVDLYRAGQ
ncbi:MAG: hypothetical protein V1794_01855 [Candidatus Glassbacteria bacterium]